MTHDTSSSPAESEPCRCGSTTLVTLVSSTCMKATTITDSVMAHLRAGEIGPPSAGDALTRGSRRLLHADDDVRGHAGPERERIAEVLGVQPDLHRNPLHDLDPVAGGVLGGQQREARAGARAEGVHGAVEDLARKGVDLDLGGHARLHARELGLLEVGEHPDLVRSEEHTSELQSRSDLVCRLLLEKKKKKKKRKLQNKKKKKKKET